MKDKPDEALSKLLIEKIEKSKLVDKRFSDRMVRDSPLRGAPRDHRRHQFARAPEVGEISRCFAAAPGNCAGGIRMML